MNFSKIEPNTFITIDKESLHRYSDVNILERAKELNADIILSDALDGKCMTIEFRQNDIIKNNK